MKLPPELEAIGFVTDPTSGCDQWFLPHYVTPGDRRDRPTWRALVRPYTTGHRLKYMMWFRDPEYIMHGPRVVRSPKSVAPLLATLALSNSLL